MPSALGGRCGDRRVNGDARRNTGPCPPRSQKKRRMRTVFSTVPDVPVSKFVLRMKGGKRGLLVNSRDLCRGRNFSSLNFKAQNGKRLRVKKLPLRTPSCKGAKSKPGKRSR